MNRKSRKADQERKRARHAVTARCDCGAAYDPGPYEQTACRACIEAMRLAFWALWDEAGS